MDVRIERQDWLDGVRGLEAGSVDLVYVDPPFNTGQRRVGRAGEYEDSWASLDAWLAWLRERLGATRPALKDTGSILLHVDWRTSHRARCVLDDVFGADRFVNHIVWAYGLGGSSPRRFARKHDDILFYCVDPARYWFDPPRVVATSARMKGQTKKATDVVRLGQEQARHADRGNGVALSRGTIHADDTMGHADEPDVGSPSPLPAVGRVLPRWSDAGEGGNCPCPPGDVLEIPSINNMARERTRYPTQKPLALLDLLVRACCPPGGLVVDPCCGSGTTLEAALRSGRRAVGFDVSADAVEVSGRRLGLGSLRLGGVPAPVGSPTYHAITRCRAD